MLAIVIINMRIVRTISVKNRKEIRKIFFKGEIGAQKHFSRIGKLELPTIRNLLWDYCGFFPCGFTSNSDLNYPQMSAVTYLKIFFLIFVSLVNNFYSFVEVQWIYNKLSIQNDLISFDIHTKPSPKSRQ